MNYDFGAFQGIRGRRSITVKTYQRPPTSETPDSISVDEEKH
jgi:hypothetical protein